ncbi:MAG: helix-turn-helix domain-containing protein [Propionibacteriaceae bacterium]|nr:helix-turn-helix domain-containing protein [Propionibacteriaceae bacterium]
MTQEQTYMPTNVGADLVAALEASPARSDGGGVLLDFPGRAPVELPAALASMLRQAVQAMSEGLAVTLRPQTRQLTTSQVADLLGVTRPTVVKLLESGKIPYMKVGTHRRVDLSDALRYRDSRREAQYQFIAGTAIDKEQPLEDAAQEMAAVRAELAQRRRQGANA